VTELQTGRYDQLLRRTGDLKGPGSKVNDVLEELFPTIDVEQVPYELLALEGTALAAGGAVRAAVAAVNNRIQLFNPAGSGKLVTVTLIHIQVGAGQDVALGLAAVALATAIGTDRLRDGRFGVGLNPSAQVRFDTNAAVSPTTFRFRVNTAGDTLEDTKGLYILTPGTGLTVTTSTVQTSLTASFFWRERVAEPSELNF